MIEIRKNTLTAAEFHVLYTSVGWDAPSMEQIEAALTHSAAVFAAYVTASHQPVGMVRLIGDGGMSFTSRILPFCRNTSTAVSVHG